MTAERCQPICWKRLAMTCAAMIYVMAVGGIHPAAATDHPNVVLFFADDLGWNGPACFGSDLHQTPNVDALARDGVKFTDAYSACTVCSPSRAAIMTGKYPARLHLTDFIAGQNQPFAQLKIPNWTKLLQHDEVTLPEALKTAGYKSAHVGKWHLSPKGNSDQGYQPQDHGFDLQVMKPPAKGYLMTKSVGDFKKGDYITDYFAAEAAGIIDQWKDDSFFLYFAFNVPHTPIQGKQKLVDAYQAKVQPDATHANATYAAMVDSMDQAIGTVLASLERSGVADNTVVIFTSDNGGLTHRYREPTGFTRNDPLRRGKGSAYEGGVRVPMIVRWPNVAPPGTVCHQPVIGPDLYPTILEIADAKIDSRRRDEIDGLSLVPLIKNPDSTLKRDAIYWHYPHYHAGGFSLPGKPGNGPYSAIRSGRWKLIEYFEDERVELYDLDVDLREANDLVQQHPVRAGELQKQLRSWQHDVGAQLPSPNPNHDPEKAR